MKRYVFLYGVREYGITPDEYFHITRERFDDLETIQTAERRIKNHEEDIAVYYSSYDFGRFYFATKKAAEDYITRKMWG